jgi:hypothetical protein
MKFLKIRLLLIVSFLSLVLVGCDIILNPYNFSDLTDEEKYMLVGSASVDVLRFMSDPIAENEDDKKIIACDLELVKTLSGLYDLSKVDTSKVFNFTLGTKDVNMILEDVGEDNIFVYACHRNFDDKMAIASIFKKDELDNFIKIIGDQAFKTKEENAYVMLLYAMADRNILDFMFNFVTIERNGYLYRVRLVGKPM